MKWLQLSVKVKKFRGKAAQATKLLYNRERVPVIDFINLLGSEKAVAEWLDALTTMTLEQPNDAEGDINSDNYPWLYQGEDEADEYLGQPQVWDGGFCYDLETNTLKFQGYRGASGWGGTVERIVYAHDIIEWQSVKPLRMYV